MGLIYGKEIQEEDYRQLSELQHFAFCKRQWALIHIEQQWEDNLRTIEGELMHERVHDETKNESRGDLLIIRGLRVKSDNLCVTGICDAVEFRRDDNGITLHGRKGKWLPRPVEYKRGKPKTNNADELQVCAQAICLEEMLCCSITSGDLFYGEKHRRQEVIFSEQLREEVKHDLQEMNELFFRGCTPKAKRTKACDACSLINVCLSRIREQWISFILSKKIHDGFRMKKLLNSIFVLSENSYLSLKNENIVVNAEDGSIRELPLLGIESIFCFTYKGASPALIGECVKRGIGITFLTPTGKFLAQACGKPMGNVLLRKIQYRISDDKKQSCQIARCFILGKIYNSRWTLERTLRDHSLRVDQDMLNKTILCLTDSYKKVLDAEDMDSLRGIEGQAANAYFNVFDMMILNQKDDFHFTVRSRRPPLDRVNAMLSFGYRLLESDCVSALENVGLDSYVGFMHQDRPGRASLALDLMEEFRSILVDRMVVTMINMHQINPHHFRNSENGAVLLNDNGRKLFINAWQTHKREEIKHPYLQERISWGLAPYTQALLLARFLRNDLDAYPVFMWK